MSSFPSSQSKAKILSLQKKIELARAASTHRHLNLYGKVLKLRTMKSNDPIQQLQSDILSDMYDAVYQLQWMMDPILLSLPHLSTDPD